MIIVLKGTILGTTSSTDGSFMLLVSDGLRREDVFDTLRLSSIRYSVTDFCIPEKAKSSLVIKLKESTSSLNEIVVVGYSTQTKNGIICFLWPPPDCSAKTVLNRSYFQSAVQLADVDDILLKALRKCGYTDKSHYYVPNGFALVTRIEQIDENGVPLLDSKERCSVETAAGTISWTIY